MKKSGTAYLYLFYGVLCVGLMSFLGSFVSLQQAYDTTKRELTETKRQLSEATVNSDCTAREVWHENTTKVFHITSSGWERSYRVHLPAGFRPQVRYPVLLAFTGKGEQAKEFELTRALDTLPAITIYPQATVGIDGATAWQGAPYSSGADDVAFVSDILDKTEGQLCIQKSHIYSLGWSNGGNFSWLLSCRLADRIAAFAMVSGAFYYPETRCNSERPAAILNIHGDQDHEVPYTGSIKRGLPDIDAWIADRAKSNGCTAGPAVAQPDLFTQVTTWNGCKNSATVQNIRLLGGGHTWPSLNLRTNTQHASVQKTPDLLWSFLRRHGLS